MTRQIETSRKPHFTGICALEAPPKKKKKNSSLVKMQPLAVLRSSQFQIQHSSPNELRPQILIRNSWLVCARINRRSLRVSLCSPFLHAVLSWSSTFLIACHSAFKLLRRGPCCESEREREREGEKRILYSRSIDHAPHTGNLCTRNDKRTLAARFSRRRARHTGVCVYYVARRRNETATERERERERERSKLGHCWCEGFNMLRQ